MRSLLSALCVLLGGSLLFADGYKAGVAKKDITPQEPMWMAGYGARNKPAEVAHHPLWIKALALEDPSGKKVLILTSDLVGIHRSMAEAVTREVAKQTGIPRDAILLTCSHTHCGPVTRDSLFDMYDMPPNEAAKIAPYTEKLRGWMVDVLVAAAKDLKPAKLSMAIGKAGFAVNRREVTPTGVANGRNPGGPVDHDVPVLRVTDEKGGLRAVLFGYACHNTTMQFYEWCGDYAGFAQIELEKAHPEAVALYWIGCGADSNPLPRSKIELCQKYGKELADAVEDVMKKPMTPLTAKITTKYAEVDIPLAAIPEKAKWQADSLSKTGAVRRRAERMLKILDDGKKIPTSYPWYPVQVWRFGDQLTWVSLGGEVVVDYVHRLKKELKGPLWVTGYANDVMAYIPSKRVLEEGGYEADSSMIYYGMPTKWAPSIEEKIISKVRELVK
jgi:neutral ceramidase